MSSPELAFVFAADERFAAPMALAVHSAITTLDARCQPAVCVLDNGLSESSRRRLQAVVARAAPWADIRFIRVPEARLAGIRFPRHLPAAAFSRVLIPELLDPAIIRATYLDSDVLVRRDASPLFRIEMGDSVVGAARDFQVRSFDPDSLELSRRETEYAKPYYNTGVLVIDVPGWRDAQVTDRALARAREQFMPWGDQDALNATVERWTTLDECWNVQTGAIGLAKRRILTDRDRYRRERELFRSGAIWHFVGLDGKPWEPPCETLGTTRWALAFSRCGWHSRAAAIWWLATWVAMRLAAWPGIAARRWRARAASLRRAVA